jgi:hypothetical protein
MKKNIITFAPQFNIANVKKITFLLCISAYPYGGNDPESLVKIADSSTGMINSPWGIADSPWGMTDSP